MSQGEIAELRRSYHRRICEDVLRVNSDGIPNNADRSSTSSSAIGKGIIAGIGMDVAEGRIPGQTAGRNFEAATKDFLDCSFSRLGHLRPGDWEFSLDGNLGDYEQYRHLHDVQHAIKENEIAFGQVQRAANRGKPGSQAPAGRFPFHSGPWWASSGRFAATLPRQCRHLCVRRPARPTPQKPPGCPPPTEVGG